MAKSPLEGLQLRLVDSVEDAQQFLSWLGERHEGVLGLDTESSGLNPYLPGEKLRLVQIGDLRTGWAIPWEQWGGVAREAFARYSGEWALHNMGHDYRWLKRRGGVSLPWHKLHDTMLQAGLDNPLRPKALKVLADQLVDPVASAGQKSLDQAMSDNGWTWATVPVDFVLYAMYGALDPVLTSHIHRKLYPYVSANCPEAYDLERGTVRVCANMMDRGMLLDVPYVHKALDDLRQYTTRARAWLKSTYGITSPNSAGQLAKTLKSYGEKIIAYTDSGAPQFDKRALTYYKVSGGAEAVRHLATCVLQVRHADRIVSAYLERFLELRDADGVIHASINTVAARTSRMSVSDPSLQNLHRKDKIVRGSFRPRDGHVFVTCDLNQVESRFAAHFTKDPGLIEAFLRAERDGTDFFCELSEPIYNARIAKSDPRRDIVKTIVYRTNYGGGDNVEEMALTAEVPYEQMLASKRAFDDRFPGVKRMLQEVTDVAKSRNPPHLFSPMRRRFILDRGQEFTQGFNALIQGHAAEYFKKCLLDIDAAGLGPYMCLPVHDEIILEVPTEMAEEALRTVVQCMTDLENYLVPITADGKILTERWQK